MYGKVFQFRIRGAINLPVSRREIHLTVVVPEKVKVETNLIKIHRVRPRALVPDIGGFDIKATWPYTIIVLRSVSVERVGNDVESALMVPNGCCPDTTSWLRGSDIELRLARECVAD